MGIPVESATFVVADLGDQFLQVLQKAGLNTGDAIGFIALLALASWGYRDTNDNIKDLRKDLQEDIKDLRKDLREDMKDLKEEIKDLSKTFSMQQQLNTYASSRPPRPWAHTSSRSHSHRERPVPRPLTHPTIVSSRSHSHRERSVPRPLTHPTIV